MFENYPPGNVLSASLKKLGTAPENLRQKGQRVTSERVHSDTCSVPSAIRTYTH